MTTVVVWLLIMVGQVNGGGLGAVQPHLFASEEACMKVARAVPELRYGGKITCVQTTVLVPK